MTLIATSRSKVGSWAAYTVPIPPRAISRDTANPGTTGKPTGASAAAAPAPDGGAATVPGSTDRSGTLGVSDIVPSRVRANARIIDRSGGGAKGLVTPAQLVLRRHSLSERSKLWTAFPPPSASIPTAE